MRTLNELIEEYHRISSYLELHKGLLATLHHVRSNRGDWLELQEFEEVVNGEARVIAIFGDRKRELEQRLFE